MEQIKNSIFVSNIIKMKRVVSLLVFALLLNGCDDGDLVLEDISFENTEVNNCKNNNIFYKLEKTKVLLLEMDKTLLPSESTPSDQPKTIVLSSSNRVVYRFYNGIPAVDNICETIPPLTPVATDQWNATAGNIQIITTAKKDVDLTNNSSKIVGYNHSITFKNITFATNTAPVTYESLVFGNYTTTLATSLPSAFDKTLKQCPSTKQIFANTNSEALTLDIDPDLIVSTSTPLNQPRTGLISATKNKLMYRVFIGLLTSDYFCTTPVPATPVISQEWNAVAGISNVSGIVEVTTTTNGTGFKHTIVLKKATLKKGNSDFTLGDNYIYGELFTTN
jgi:hypothetical protein